MRILNLVIIVISGLLLSACTLVPGSDVEISKADRKYSDETPSITLDQIEFYKITASNTKYITTKKRQPHRNASLDARVKNYSYKVGVGDILQVTVWEHPELLNLGKEGLPAIGFLVDSQGFIFYPYVGRIHVSGLSSFSIRDLLSKALAKYIENPQLDVTVTKFASQRIHLTGEIVRPLPIILQSHATTLLDALNAAGGLTARADLNDVVVIRAGKRRHIDVYALMHFGDMRQNILMRDGDQIHVASQKPKNVYVMGQVASPLTVGITPEGLTLAEAIGRARGLNESSADASAVYVIRDSKLPRKVAKVHMLDLSNMAAMVLAAKFELNNGDVVYIAKAPIVKWNQFLSIISPSLEVPGKLNAAQDGAAAIFN